MKHIRLIKNWDYPNLLRQTPFQDGIWEDICVSENLENYDYVIVLNHVTKNFQVHCPPENIWCLTQEPPVPEYEWLRKGFSQFHAVYSQDMKTGLRNVIPSAPANPWWLDKSYMQLKTESIPHKTHTISWVMSNKAARVGHLSRLGFLEDVQSKLDFDLWGRGFRSFEDKWDAIAPYRYSICLENQVAAYYWTEKLSDVLLAWSLPIYYGAPNITDFLPSEAIIQIDINKPDEAVATIQDVIASKQWEKRLDAIAYARELILDRWQFFPYLKTLIDNFEKSSNSSAPKTVRLRKTYEREPNLIVKMKQLIRNLRKW